MWVEVPFEVQKPQEGQRLDAFLARRLHRYSRAEVQRLIAEGRVFLRGRNAKPATRVADGDTVLIRYPHREEPPPNHAAFPVLYEDEHLLGINKPGDVLSHPTDRVVANSVTSILRGQFPGAKLHLVHRLDRETSGILILAKNPKVARALTDRFTDREVKKEYLAIVAGKMGFKRKTVDRPLGYEGAEIKVRQAVIETDGAESENGRGISAATDFERLASNGIASLVHAAPRTGRLHQIRVHLAWLGHPVLGDKLYTGSGEMYMKTVRRELAAEDLERLGAPRQMLHAWKIKLAHPATQVPLEIVAPLPMDFERSLERFYLRFPR